MTLIKSSLLAAGLSLAAHMAAVAAEPAAELKALYEAARTAGETDVVVYTPYGNHQPIWDAFAQAFPGIRPTVVVTTGAPLFAKLEAERTTGKFAGDLLFSNLTTVTLLQKQDYFVPDVPSTIAALPERYKEPGGYFQVPFLNLFTVVYNTRLVPENKLPKTLDDVLADEWKGKITFGQVNGTGATDFNLATLRYNNAITEAQLRKVHENAVPAESNAAAIQLVAQGRALFDLWTPTQSVVPLQNDGAPLGIALLEDSAAVWGPGFGLLANAPHPNAARLLKAWIYTPEAQSLFALHTNSYGTLPGTPKPEKLPGIDYYTFKDIPAAQASEVIGAYRKVAGAIWGF
ncbi:extracellular solute-binding protein [Rhizobium sp. P007]|jgi:iron(III) transport system substrate-binding protein|uniref:ABC transporter substrate-binding protein n=1 Tax=Rhizobium sp. P007 TaxID=285908 RepID=UPI00115B8C46|nr:extracellular solute-binding protein [Rhizobium sp. P007]CAD7045398.1 ABC transporter substrate-binding protein [Rhizobium sp. P007]